MTLAGGTLWRAAAVIALAALVGILFLFFSRSRSTSEQTFLGHLEELRRRLLLSSAAVVATMAFLFSFDWPPGGWPRPALHDNLAARLFLRARDDLVPDSVTLIVSRPMDGFAAEMALSLGAALVLTSPFWIWQIGGFLWPALRPKEQRMVLRAFVPVVVLFLAGAAFAYVFVLPFILATLYDYGAALGAQGLLPVSEFVSFALSMILVFGIAFQTPLVMATLTRTGLVPAAFWGNYWRHAIVVIFILSALVTDPTIVSQVLVAVPLTILYAAGLVLSRRAERVK